MDVEAEIKRINAKLKRRINKQAKEATARVDEHADRLEKESFERWHGSPKKVRDLQW